MAKQVSLSVHRNTVENRRKRDLAKSLRNGVEAMVKDRDIRAYAVVGIASDGQAYAMWDTGSVLPMWAFADTVSNVLRTDINASGLEDDWRPSLTTRG